MRRIGCWLFAVLAIVYLASTRAHFVGSDELNIYQTTRSLYENGDLAVGFPNNAAMGPDGRRYAIYNAGLAFIALPFYALAEPFEAVLRGLGLTNWIRTFSGPQLGVEPARFGGDIEIWFTNLTNVFLTALLGVVFFRASVLYGARVRTAVVAALALGLATYVGPFASGLLRHTAEALFMFSALYFVMRDMRHEAGGNANAWWAGCMLALLVQCRLAAGLALPGIVGLYLLGRWRRIAEVGESADRVRSVVSAIVPLAVPLALSGALYASVNFIKFGSVFGQYGAGIGGRFETPLGYGLHAFLSSPGASIFVFTPLLLLLPWLMGDWFRRSRAECLAVAVVFLSYLLFYAQFSDWHGHPTALGPRYLMAITPLLLLPLALWLDGGVRWRLAAFGLLVAVGFFVQFLHVAVSFGYVYDQMGWASYQPPLGFMFDWADSPLVAHFRALGSPELVDSWLVTVYEQDGAGRVTGIALVLALALCGAVWRLLRAIRAFEGEAAPEAAEV